MMSIASNRGVLLACAVLITGCLYLIGCRNEDARTSHPAPSVSTRIVPLEEQAGPPWDPTRPCTIAGKITDAETGQSLPYCNVVVLGTTLGGISLDDGTFSINVPPGMYLVQAVYIGYKKEAHETTVLPTQAARVDFELQPEAFKADTIEISADRMLIQGNQAASVHRVDPGEMKQIPPQDVNEAIALRAGTVNQGGELNFRGGRGGEVATYVDGMPVRDPWGQSRPRHSAQATQSAGVRTEGFEAEYGNGQSGVVNISGHPSRHGKSTHVRSNRPAQATTALPIGLHDELWVIERSFFGHPGAPATPPTSGDITYGTGDVTYGTGVMLARTGDGKRHVPVPLKHTAVESQISAYIATVVVRQEFENPFDQKIEAVYNFPLPQNAAVGEFVMTIGDRRIRGIIREREEAQRIYHEARRQGHVASLLTQERPNIFTQAIANIEPGEEIDVEIYYYHTLAYVDGWYEYVFPMVVAPRFNPPGHDDPVLPVARGTSSPATRDTQIEYLRPDERTGHDITLDLHIDAGVTLEGIESVNHAVDITRPAFDQAKISLAANDRIPNKDFVLRYKVAGDQVKTTLMTHEDDRGGFFSLILYPPASMQDSPRSPVEMIFVLDCSGSMSGEPITKGKTAIDRALRNLRPDDTFQLIRFSNRASQLGRAPLPATAANIARGREHLASLRSSGGTEMIGGIKAALDFPHDPRRLRLVSFVTDGHIGNEEEIFRETRVRLGAARIFSFGIGSSVNRYLLDGLARFGRGAVAYVGLDESAGQAVDQFYERVRYPALTDISIDWGGMQVSDVYPAHIPDLFPGRAVILTGRFEGKPGNAIHVFGKVAGEQRRLSVAVRAPRSREEHPGIPSVWARQRIRDVMDLIAVRPGRETVREVTQFACEFGLMSRYTAFIAVDSRSKTGTDPAVSAAVAVPVAEGMRYETTVGGSKR